MVILRHGTGPTSRTVGDTHAEFRSTSIGFNKTLANCSINVRVKSVKGPGVSGKVLFPKLLVAGTYPVVGKARPDLKYLTNFHTVTISERLLSWLRFIQQVSRNLTFTNKSRLLSLMGTSRSPKGSEACNQAAPAPAPAPGMGSSL